MTAFAPTQAQLADALALTSVHVNRTLQGLRAEAVIKISGRDVQILDWERLADIGEFEPKYLQTDAEPEQPSWMLAAAPDRMLPG